MRVTFWYTRDREYPLWRPRCSLVTYTASLTATTRPLSHENHDAERKHTDPTQWADSSHHSFLRKSAWVVIPRYAPAILLTDNFSAFTPESFYYSLISLELSETVLDWHETNSRIIPVWLLVTTLLLSLRFTQRDNLMFILCIRPLHNRGLFITYFLWVSLKYNMIHKTDLSQVFFRSDVMLSDYHLQQSNLTHRDL